MTDTILAKDTICVAIGDDHTYGCTTVTLGRTGENAISQLEITLPEALCHFWAYLDFKKPKGKTVRTPRIPIENCKIEYDIPLNLLDENGNLEVQLVLQSETGEIWKSATKKYVVLKSIDAVDTIPEEDKTDFITEAQKVLNETKELADEARTALEEMDTLAGKIVESAPNFAGAIKESVSGKTVVTILDISSIEHELKVRVNPKGSVTRYAENLLPYPHLYEVGKAVTSAGVTYVDNGDYTITANGTVSSSSSTFKFYDDSPSPYLPKGNYIFFGCGEGDKVYASDAPFIMHLTLWDIYGNQTEYKSDLATRTVKFTVNNPIERVRCYVRIYRGVNVVNQKYYALLLNEDNGTVYTAKANGTVEGITSAYPITTLLADYGATITAEYNIDTKKYIDKKFTELASMIVNS